MNDTSVDLFAPSSLARQPRAIEASERRFEFVIAGEPVAKGRGRIIKMGPHMGIKTPDATRRYEDRVRQTAVRDWGYRGPLAECGVTMFIKVYRGIAPSWPRKRRDAAVLGSLRPTGRPDVDNFAKSILDGLNGVVLDDDAMVVDLRVQKFYAIEPRVEVEITW